jgi:pimeloyl-ACP methyl ester carboxylesterase
MPADTPRLPRREARFAGFSNSTIVLASAAALALSAYVNHRLAKKAERANPPAGTFLSVNGVRLHFVDRGEGAPLVLLHGNGSMVQDFQSSGLLDLAATKYRVIAFDRPGYGHSSRPRSTAWTPEAQAHLIHEALAQIGVERATVLGHSWGCLVAVALAHRYPGLVGGLVLASGYYYPTVRADVVAMSPPAVPVVGDIVRYSISPLLSRLAWPLLMRKLFGPQSVPPKFAGFPKAMAMRPSHIRAAAVESALMIPGASAARRTYADLKMPVAIVAGSEDRLVDIKAHSARLNGEVPQSSFRNVPGAGHMIHQTATGCVMSAIDEVSVSVAAIGSTEDAQGSKGPASAAAE